VIICEACSASPCSCGNLTVNKHFASCRKCDDTPNCKGCGTPYELLGGDLSDIDLSELDDYPEIDDYSEIDLSDADFSDAEDEVKYIEKTSRGYCFYCEQHQLIHGANYKIPKGKYQYTMFYTVFNSDPGYIMSVIRHRTPMCDDFRRCLEIYTEGNPELLNNYIINFGQFTDDRLSIEELYRTQSDYFNYILSNVFKDKEANEKMKKFQFMTLWYLNYVRTGSYRFGYLRGT
jgi:hypothetical protein